MARIIESRKRRTTKGIARLVAALFLFMEVFSFPSQSFAQGVLIAEVQDEENPAFLSGQSLINESFWIPAELGRIDETYGVPRTEYGGLGAAHGVGRKEDRKSGMRGAVHRTPYSLRRTVVFIQDAHDSFEAQENIAKIIKHLVANYGVKTVFEEGYEGPVLTDELFGFIQEPALKQKVSWFFLDKLRLRAAEYAHINQQSYGGRSTAHLNGAEFGTVRRTPYADWQLIGADSLKLHKENIDQYRLSAEKKEAITKDLEALEKELKSLADRRFPKEFKEWLKIKAQFDAKKLDLFTYLARTMPLVRSTETGARTKNPPYAVRLAPSESVFAPLLSFILEATKSKDPVVIEKAKHIDAREVFAELQKLETAVVETYLGDWVQGIGYRKDSEPEKLSPIPYTQNPNIKLYSHYKNLQLVKRLNDLEVTQEEYSALRASLELGVRNSEQFSRDRTHAPEFLDTQALAEFIHAETRKPLVLSKQWERNIQDAVKFYEIALQRDDALSTALDKYFSAGQRTQYSKLSGVEPAILVYGGFHKENIKRILEAKGISYVVVSPKITQPSLRHEAYYKQLMADGFHKFELPFLLRTAASQPTLVNLDPQVARAEIRAVCEAASRYPHHPETWDRYLDSPGHESIAKGTGPEDENSQEVARLAGALAEGDRRPEFRGKGDDEEETSIFRMSRHSFLKMGLLLFAAGLFSMAHVGGAQPTVERTIFRQGNWNVFGTRDTGPASEKIRTSAGLPSEIKIVNGRHQIFSVKGNGFLRGTLPGMDWGTSFVLPGYWSQGRYFHNPRITHASFDLNEKGELRLKGVFEDQNGNFESDDFEVIFSTAPRGEALMKVSFTVKAKKDFTLDQERLRNYEGFRIAQFSSMNVSLEHDADTAEYRDEAGERIETKLENKNQVIFPEPRPLGSARTFYLKNKNPVSGRNNPTTYIRLAESMDPSQFTLQGWVTKTQDVNDDNVGGWIHFDAAKTYYRSGETIGRFAFFLGIAPNRSEARNQPGEMEEDTPALTTNRIRSPELQDGGDREWPDFEPIAIGEQNGKTISVKDTLESELPAARFAFEKMMQLRGWMDRNGKENVPLVIWQNMRLGELYPYLGSEIKKIFGILELTKEQYRHLAYSPDPIPGKITASRYLLIKDKVPSSFPSEGSSYDGSPEEEWDSSLVLWLVKDIKRLGEKLKAPVLMIDHSSRPLSGAQDIVKAGEKDTAVVFEESPGSFQAIKTTLDKNGTAMVILNAARGTAVRPGASVFDRLDGLFLEKNPEKKVRVSGQELNFFDAFRKVYETAILKESLRLETPDRSQETTTFAEIKAVTPKNTSRARHWYFLSQLFRALFFKKVLGLDFSQGKHRVVDVGVGALPVTTVEMAERFQKEFPGAISTGRIEMIGIEIPEAVPYAHITAEGLVDQFRGRFSEGPVEESFRRWDLKAITLTINERKEVTGAFASFDSENGTHYRDIAIRQGIPYLNLGRFYKGRQGDLLKEMIEFLDPEKIRYALSQGVTGTFDGISVELDPVRNMLEKAGVKLVVTDNPWSAGVRDVRLMTVFNVIQHIPQEGKLRFLEQLAQSLKEGKAERGKLIEMGGILAVKGGRLDGTPSFAETYYTNVNGHLVEIETTLHDFNHAVMSGQELGGFSVNFEERKLKPVWISADGAGASRSEVRMQQELRDKGEFISALSDTLVQKAIASRGLSLRSELRSDFPETGKSFFTMERFRSVDELRLTDGNKIPVFVSQEHHEIIEWIKSLQKQGIATPETTLVNFDAHPDTVYENLHEGSWVYWIREPERKTGNVISKGRMVWVRGKAYEPTLRGMWPDELEHGYGSPKENIFKDGADQLKGHLSGPAIITLDLDFLGSSDERAVSLEEIEGRIQSFLRAVFESEIQPVAFHISISEKYLAKVRDYMDIPAGMAPRHEEAISQMLVEAIQGKGMRFIRQGADVLFGARSEMRSSLSDHPESVFQDEKQADFQTETDAFRILQDPAFLEILNRVKILLESRKVPARYLEDENMRSLLTVVLGPRISNNDKQDKIRECLPTLSRKFASGLCRQIEEIGFPLSAKVMTGPDFIQRLDEFLLRPAREAYEQGKLERAGQLLEMVLSVKNKAHPEVSDSLLSELFEEAKEIDTSLQRIEAWFARRLIDDKGAKVIRPTDLPATLQEWEAFSQEERKIIQRARANGEKLKWIEKMHNALIEPVINRAQRINNLQKFIVQGRTSLQKQFAMTVMIVTNWMIDLFFIYPLVKMPTIAGAVWLGRATGLGVLQVAIVAGAAVLLNVEGGLVRLFLIYPVFKLIWPKLLRINRKGLIVNFVPSGPGNFAPFLFFNPTLGIDMPLALKERYLISRQVEKALAYYPGITEKIIVDITESIYQAELQIGDSFNYRRFKIRRAKEKHTQEAYAKKNGGESKNPLISFIKREDLSNHFPFYVKIKDRFFRWVGFPAQGYRKGTRPTLLIGDSRQLKKIKQFLKSDGLSEEQLGRVYQLDLTKYFQKIGVSKKTFYGKKPLAGEFIRPMFPILEENTHQPQKGKLKKTAQNPKGGGSVRPGGDKQNRSELRQPSNQESQVPDVTWEELKQQGYDLYVSRDQMKGEDFYEWVGVVKKDGRILEGSNFVLQVFPRSQFICIELFFPRFPIPVHENDKNGKGRALLRELLALEDYTGFSVVSMATGKFPASLAKMKELHPVVDLTESPWPMPLINSSDPEIREKIETLYNRVMIADVPFAEKEEVLGALGEATFIGEVTAPFYGLPTAREETQGRSESRSNSAYRDFARQFRTLDPEKDEDSKVLRAVREVMNQLPVFGKSETGPFGISRADKMILMNSNTNLRSFRMQVSRYFSEDEKGRLRYPEMVSWVSDQMASSRVEGVQTSQSSNEFIPGGSRSESRIEKQGSGIFLQTRRIEYSAGKYHLRNRNQSFSQWRSLARSVLRILETEFDNLAIQGISADREREVRQILQHTLSGLVPDASQIVSLRNREIRRRLNILRNALASNNRNGFLREVYGLNQLSWLQEPELLSTVRLFRGLRDIAENKWQVADSLQRMNSYLDHLEARLKRVDTLGSLFQRFVSKYVELRSGENPLSHEDAQKEAFEATVAQGNFDFTRQSDNRTLLLFYQLIFVSSREHSEFLESISRIAGQQAFKAPGRVPNDTSKLATWMPNDLYLWAPQVVLEALSKFEPLRSELRQSKETGKYFVLNKPVGFITTEKQEPNAPDTPIAWDLLPSDVKNGRHFLGRLDKDTSGLLLVGGNAELNQLLLNPKRNPEHKVRKTYEAVVGGHVTENSVNRLKQGVVISAEGKEYLVHANELRILERFWEGKRPLTRLEIVISEGKFHQIRTMLRVVGHQVLELRRTAFGPILLENLAPGSWRELSSDEYSWLSGRLPQSPERLSESALEEEDLDPLTGNPETEVDLPRSDDAAAERRGELRSAGGKIPGQHFLSSAFSTKENIAELEKPAVFVIEKGQIAGMPRSELRQLMVFAAINRKNLWMVVPDMLEGRNSQFLEDLKSLGVRISRDLPEIAKSSGARVIGFSDKERDTAEDLRVRLSRQSLRLANGVTEYFAIEKGEGLFLALLVTQPEDLAVMNGFRYDKAGRFQAALHAFLNHLMNSYVVTAVSA